MLILSEEDGRTTITSGFSTHRRRLADTVLNSGMQEGASESFDRIAVYLRAMA